MYTESWKKFLKESIDSDDPEGLDELPIVEIVDFDDLDEYVEHEYVRFAFTDKRQNTDIPGSRYFTFQPRVPLYTLGGEDDFTPRTCWGSSAEACKKAIGGWRDQMYLFGVRSRDMKGFVEPMTIVDIWASRTDEVAAAIATIKGGSESNKYSPVWYSLDDLVSKMNNYVEDSDDYDHEDLQHLASEVEHLIGRNLGLKSDLWKSIIKYCVPDSAETGEVWTTQPTKAEFIGVVKHEACHMINWKNVINRGLMEKEPEQIELPFGV